MNTDKLQRLLDLTAENKSSVIQDLRKEIIIFANEMEKYISEVEMENFGLLRENRILIGFVQHERVLRSLLTEAYAQG